jgi:integrase
MGRRNERGLELSFKPASGSRGRGRWYKKIDGQAHYFGWGAGVTDRASYQGALVGYRRHVQERLRSELAGRRGVVIRQLQDALSPADYRPDVVRLDDLRQLVAELKAVEGDPAAWERAGDSIERGRLIREQREKLEAASLDDLRQLVRPPSREAAPPAATLREVLRDFVAAQRERMERGAKLDALRAAGQDVRAAGRTALKQGRFVEITYNAATFERVCGDERWDGTEAAAARVVAKLRRAAERMMLAGEVKPRTFNKWITLARQFCGWAESAYRLDRLPRDRALFAKYEVGESTAKAVPPDVLRTLWDAADDRGRCFILLGLNCGFYAVDISDLTAEQVGETHLRHRRGKTGVRVRYLLWPETRALLAKVGARSGRAFRTRDGTPLVHYSTLAKSGEPARVDNVRNWWVRLCAAAGVKGFTFSNLRDTASTAVESIDRSMTDLFLAHSDPRMAKLYVDGEMVDSTRLDAVIDELRSRFRGIWVNRDDG